MKSWIDLVADCCFVFVQNTISGFGEKEWNYIGKGSERNRLITEHAFYDHCTYFLFCPDLNRYLRLRCLKLLLLFA